MASNGWLQRFILRHDLTFKKVCGEVADVNDKELKEWKESKLSDVLKRYNPCDIYNADEYELFYHASSDKTLSFKNEKCIRGKKSKGTLSVLLAANMDGSEKLTSFGYSKIYETPLYEKHKSSPMLYESIKKPG